MEGKSRELETEVVRVGSLLECCDADLTQIGISILVKKWSSLELFVALSVRGTRSQTEDDYGFWLVPQPT